VAPGQIVIVDLEGVDPEAAGSRAADDKEKLTFRGEPKPPRQSRPKWRV
jgi:ATP-dependent Clp protease ATP-binding subunit ClpC